MIGPVKIDFEINETVLKMIHQTVAHMAVIYPEADETDMGVSTEVARARITIMLAAAIVAALNFDQPLEYILENVAQIHKIMKPMVIVKNPLNDNEDTIH